MEVEGGHNVKYWVLLYEFIGTAGLLYAVNCSSEAGMAPYAAGMAIMSGICIFGEVSGGHFNPAISLAVFIAEGRENFGYNFGFLVALTFV